MLINTITAYEVIEEFSNIACMCYRWSLYIMLEIWVFDCCPYLSHVTVADDTFLFLTICPDMLVNLAGLVTSVDVLSFALLNAYSDGFPDTSVPALWKFKGKRTKRRILSNL